MMRRRTLHQGTTRRPYFFLHDGEFVCRERLDTNWLQCIDLSVHDATRSLEEVIHNAASNFALTSWLLYSVSMKNKCSEMVLWALKINAKSPLCLKAKFRLYL